MIDNEIIMKAIECCRNCSCKDCPFEFDENCIDVFRTYISKIEAEYTDLALENKALKLDLEKANKELAEVENKRKSGQLVEFKYKVGDKLYGVIQCQREWYVAEVEINDQTFYSNEVRYFTIKFGWVTDDYLFTTKEEAEAKLKELQGKNK